MAAKKKASKKKVKKSAEAAVPAKKKKAKKNPAEAPATAGKKTGKKKAPVKKGAGKKKAAAKKPAAKKAPVEKNAFGHRVGTLTNVMDKLLIKGTTLEAGATAMVEYKGGDADPKACARQIKTHIKYLEDKKGGVVSFMKKSGKYKVTPPTA
jgi:hypothetical protein